MRTIKKKLMLKLKQFNDKIQDLIQHKSELPMTPNEMRLLETMLNSKSTPKNRAENRQYSLVAKRATRSLLHNLAICKILPSLYKDPRLIVSYMGIENIRLWVGYLCNRRWLPLKIFDCTIRSNAY